MIKTRINGCWDILLPEHRAARPEWSTPEGWEKKRLDHMFSKIRKGDVVYYVGSEEGEMPALCQMWGAEVVLIEPNPKVWSNTRAIWEANGLDTPITYEGFASSKTINEWGRPTGVRGWPESAYQPIDEAHGFKDLKTEGKDFPQIRIDELVGCGDTRYPTHICIDVEGSEGEVLRGADHILNSHVKPSIWLSLHPEFLHEQYGEWGAELRKWLMGMGYKETLLDYPLHEVHLYYEAIK